MKLVKISDAKTNLSKHLEFVRRGGRIRILDRDTPVADLVPVDSSVSTGADDATLASLERRGLLRRGKGGRPDAELLRPGPGDSKGRAVAALLEERRERLGSR